MTIFVSHSSSDAEVVRSLVQSLEAAGGRVWLDQDLTGGEAWWTAILRQIRECSVFVFALSENALQSEACLLELTYARDLGLPILPVQLGDLRGLRDHAIFAYQAIDYRNPTASAGIALVRAIQERERERQPLPDPLPPAPPPPYEYLMLLGTAINGRATLSPSEQESIVLQLRQALREEKNDAVRANVRTLLATLRERPEVTHRTVTEINTVWARRPRRPAPRHRHSTVTGNPPSNRLSSRRPGGIPTREALSSCATGTGGSGSNRPGCPPTRRRSAYSSRRRPSPRRHCPSSPSPWPGARC